METIKKNNPHQPHQISYKKDNIRDAQISEYIDQMKDGVGISNYIKILVEQDMKAKGVWKYY